MMKGRKLLSLALSLAVAVTTIATMPMMPVQAEEITTPYVDKSTDHIELSPQSTTMRMNVKAKNVDVNTELAFRVADGNIVSVAWVNVKDMGYTQMEYTKGDTQGETTVTVYMVNNPDISTDIKVTNSDVAASFSYEGTGCMDIHGLNLPPIAYQFNVTADDPSGVFGLTYTDAVGDTQLLVNKAGAYTGSATISKGANATTLHVLATGHWTMTITPVLAASTTNFAGTGDKTSGRFRGDGEKHTVYCANYANKGNYIVWLYDITDMDNVHKYLLANGVGTYGKNKKVTLYKDHNYYISVRSESNWTVDFGKGDAVTVLE